MLKVEKNARLRDFYPQLLLIYLHLNYNGRRCHQHCYLVLMEHPYRLNIFNMCLQDVAQLTMCTLMLTYTISLVIHGEGGLICPKRWGIHIQFCKDIFGDFMFFTVQVGSN